MISKKGTEEAPLSFIVGLIFAVLLGSALFLIAFQYIAYTNKAKESFDTLVGNIQALKDKEKGSMAFSLPENYILVSFTEGKDHPEEGTCDEKVNVPESCGTLSCLCLCDTRFVRKAEEACVKSAKACYPFTGQEAYTFSDALCDDTSLYREGPASGVFTLYYERDGNSIQFCDGSCGEKVA